MSKSWILTSISQMRKPEAQWSQVTCLRSPAILDWETNVHYKVYQLASQQDTDDMLNLGEFEEGLVKGLDFPRDVSGKESTCQWRRLHWYLGHEDPLEEGMATHPSMLSWRIPWTEEPDGLQSIESQRVRHDCSDLACTHTVKRLLKWCNGEGNSNPLQDSWLENSMGRGAWHATVRAATKSQTRLSTTCANGGAGSRKMINAGRQASERRAVPTTRFNATRRGGDYCTDS